MAAIKRSTAKVEPDISSGQPTPQPIVLRQFHGTVELDALRLGRDAARIADEVVAHLAGLSGARVKITLEISVEAREGIPENVVRIVSENCSTLKFKLSEFDE